MYTLIIEDKHGGIADEYSFEEGEFYIGRSHTSDIILPSDNVSRRHARLYTVDGKCYIEDLNSSNGVFVNGRRIQEVYQIQRSAQIKVGDYYLHIESDADQGSEEERTFCKLTGRNLAFVNQVFRVQRKVNLMGRGKDCTLTIIDPSVSRIHAKLSVERSGAITLEDLKSSNGTFVNDERIEVATLGHRDVIRLGNVEFLIELPDQETIAPPKRTDTRDSRRERGTAPKKVEAPPERAPDPVPESRPAERPAPRPERSERPERPARAPEPESRPAERPVAAALATSSMPEFSRPPEAAMLTRDKPPKASLAEELWPGDKPEGSNKTVWIVAIATVLIIAGVMVFLFKDKLFGSSPEARPKDPVAETAPPVPSPADKALEAQKAREKKQREIAAIIEKGNEAIKEKNWDYAQERFEAALELDPLNDTARAAVNRIIAWKADKERLEEARKLRDSLKRGEAAKKLREIGDTSVYFADAQQALTELMNSKSTLELNAESLLRAKDCAGAIATLREVQLIDPKDPAVSVKIEDIEKLVGTRKCKE